MYKVTCNYCGHTEYHGRAVDFSSQRCLECNSLAFGCKTYQWISLDRYHGELCAQEAIANNETP